MRRSPTLSPGEMVRSVTTLSAPTTSTLLVPWISWTARWGTRMAFSATSAAARTRPNWPGRRSPSGFGNSAMIERVPVFRSTARSAMTTVPLCGKTLPSARISSSAAPPLACPFFRMRHEPEVFRLADAEIDADRVDARHGVQKGGLALAHEVPGGHLALADQALDGRPDRAVAHVQLRLDDGGLGGRDRGLGLLDAALLVDLRRVDTRLLGLDFGPGAIQIRDRVVVVLLGYGPPLGQRLQAPLVRFGLAEAREGHVEIGLGALDQGVVLGERQIRLGLGELRLGLQELRLVLALVEREEELVFLHHGAFGEVLRLQERRHPGADLHRLLGVGLRDELAVDRHRLLDDFRDHHGRGRRGGRGLLASRPPCPDRRQSARRPATRHRAPSRPWPTIGHSGTIGNTAISLSS